MALNEFLGRRIVRQPTNPWVQLGVGFACAAAALAGRIALTPLLRETTPFILFFPAVTLASTLAGPRGGLACLAASVVGAYVFFLPHFGAGPGQGRWIAGLIFLLSAGAIIWLTSVLRQALIQVSQAREHERLMLGELQHRVKNTLAVVQALAAQTVQSSGDSATFKRQFTDRLVALAQAHNLLSDAAWAEVDLREVAASTLAPFVAGQPGRLVLAGEPLNLSPDHVVSLALCLHELATNATKYGALSIPAGRIELRWRIVAASEPRRVRVEWSEHDGPPVASPSRQGFGSRLLKQGVSNRARPVVEIDFAPEGVRWMAEFDVDGPAAP